MSISREISYIGDFEEDAKKLMLTYGQTDLYTTGHQHLDRYLHGNSNLKESYKYMGGFGRKDGYEIVLIYGPTGIGKSTVALNMIAPAIAAGVQVGLLVLEDDMADVSVRLSFCLTQAEYAKMNVSQNVRCLPQDALVKSWSLPDLLEYIEDWFNDGIELILLDHLQFAFEGAESVKGENEYTAQRVFMQQLNQLIKKHKKTVVLISHINKSAAKGMDKIQGSGAIAQAATKTIEIWKEEDTGNIAFFLRKSRFTPTPNHEWHMVLKDGKLYSA